MIEVYLVWFVFYTKECIKKVRVGRSIMGHKFGDGLAIYIYIYIHFNLATLPRLLDL
jgi:hypothetical protein